MIGISKGATLNMLRRILKMEKQWACWVPNLLQERQKHARVKLSKKRIKNFPTYVQRNFSEIITVDESWIHFFQSRRKIRDRVRVIKHSRRSCIARRTMISKRVMCAIFLYTLWAAIQVPVLLDKPVTARFYKRNKLRKLNRYYQKRRQKTTGTMRGIYHLHVNASSHKASIVTSYFGGKKSLCSKIHFTCQI